MEPTNGRAARQDTLSVAAVILALVALVGMVVAVGIAAAAGGGGQAATGSAAGSATVSLKEFAIEPKVIEVAAGATLTVNNDGSVPHNLTVEGSDVKTADLNAGESATLSTSALEEGTYKVFCSVPGHEAAGMVGELHVGAGGAKGQAGQAAAHGASKMTAEEMDAAAAARVKAYPAETKGEGAQPLAPTVLPDGTKEFTLTADVFQWEVEPGKTVEAWGYNGQIPGPLLQVYSGDKVRITVTNNLKESTSIHLHGLDIPNSEDGVPDVTQPQIKAGETYSYNFVAEGPAVGMYHAHSNSQVQVPMGLAGPIYVDDMPLPGGITPTQRIPMVLNDAGNIGFALNGKSFPATKPILAKVDEPIVVDYYNEGLQIHPMHLHGPTQLVVAKDGHPLPAPFVADTVLIAPGERYTVLVRPNRPGTWVFHCHVLTHAEAPSGFFGMTTAMIVS